MCNTVEIFIKNKFASFDPGRLHVVSRFLLDILILILMVTSQKISSEAFWDYKKYVWTTENWNGGRENHK